MRLDRLIAARAVPLAPCEAWPVVLRDPPWRRKTRAAETIVLELQPIATPFSHEFGAYEAMDRDSYQYRGSHILADMENLAA